MTREEYEAAKIAMQQSLLGTITESTWPKSGHRGPYLLARLAATHDPESAVEASAKWMKLAIEVRGYFTVNTYLHCNDCEMSIMISCDIPEDGGAIQ